MQIEDTAEKIWLIKPAVPIHLFSENRVDDIAPSQLGDSQETSRE